MIPVSYTALKPPPKMRVGKVIALRGRYSKRGAEIRMRAGTLKVLVNGVPVTDPATKVNDLDRVEVLPEADNDQ